MPVTISLESLAGQDVCQQAVADFQSVHGEMAEGEWTRENQLEILQSNLMRWIGAAHRRGIIPQFNLEGEDLSGKDLNHADLGRSKLNNANLSGANLAHTNLGRTEFVDADLSGANLKGANLSRANLTRANLSGANLSGAILAAADLTDADLTGAILTDADFITARADEAPEGWQLVDGLLKRLA